MFGHLRTLFCGFSTRRRKEPAASSVLFYDEVGHQAVMVFRPERLSHFVDRSAYPRFPGIGRGGTRPSIAPRACMLFWLPDGFSDFSWTA